MVGAPLALERLAVGDLQLGQGGPALDLEFTPFRLGGHRGVDPGEVEAGAGAAQLLAQGHQLFGESLGLAEGQALEAVLAQQGGELFRRALLGRQHLHPGEQAGAGACDLDLLIAPIQEPLRCHDARQQHPVGGLLSQLLADQARRELGRHDHHLVAQIGGQLALGALQDQPGRFGRQRLLPADEHTVDAMGLRLGHRGPTCLPNPRPSATPTASGRAGVIHRRGV